MFPWASPFPPLDLSLVTGPVRWLGCLISKLPSALGLIIASWFAFLCFSYSHTHSVCICLSLKICMLSPVLRKLVDQIPTLVVPGKNRWGLIHAAFAGILEKTIFSMFKVSLLLIMMTSIYLIKACECLTKKNTFVTISKYNVCPLNQNGTPRWMSPLLSPYPDCSFAILPFFKQQCLFFIDVSALWQIHFSMKRNIINLSHLY